MMFLIKKQSGFGFINEVGCEILPCVYAYASDFNDGCAGVSHENMWHIIDEHGGVLYSKNCAYLDAPIEGLSIYQAEDSELYGYVNLIGEEITPPIYEIARDSSEGCCLVNLNDIWTAIDHSGKRIVGDYNYLTHFSEGLAGFLDSHEGLCGYIDATGSIIVRPSFLLTKPFNRGFAPAQCPVKRLWGYVNHRGNWIIQPQFSSAGSFEEGLAIVQEPESREFVFINYLGATIIRGGFATAQRFSGGRAFVTKELLYDSDGENVSRWGMINRDGYEMTPFHFVPPSMKELRFRNGMAYVGFADNPGKVAYINIYGEIIWEYETP